MDEKEKLTAKQAIAYASKQSVGLLDLWVDAYLSMIEAASKSGMVSINLPVAPPLIKKGLADYMSKNKFLIHDATDCGTAVLVSWDRAASNSSPSTIG